MIDYLNYFCLWRIKYYLYLLAELSPPHVSYCTEWPTPSYWGVSFCLWPGPLGWPTDTFCYISESSALCKGPVPVSSLWATHLSRLEEIQCYKVEIYTLAISNVPGSYWILMFLHTCAWNVVLWWVETAPAELGWMGDNFDIFKPSRLSLQLFFVSQLNLPGFAREISINRYFCLSLSLSTTYFTPPMCFTSLHTSCSPQASHSQFLLADPVTFGTGWSSHFWNWLIQSLLELADPVTFGTGWSSHFWNWLIQSLLELADPVTFGTGWSSHFWNWLIQTLFSFLQLVGRQLMGWAPVRLGGFVQLTVYSNWLLFFPAPAIGSYW